MHRGALKGYRSGGLVGGAVASKSFPATNPPTQVVVNNYGSQDGVSVQTRRGPVYKEIIEITVAKQMARGRFDKAMQGRFGARPSRRKI